jgi:MFS family permease
MAVRRLPVVQEPTGEDAEAAARPGWHWTLIGSGLLVTIWAPLAALVGWVVRAFPTTGSGAATVAAVLSLALASATAGFLVSRFGPRAELRHIGYGGLLGAAELWLIGLLGSAFAPWLVAIAAIVALSAITTGFALIGAKAARRRKVQR